MTSRALYGAVPPAFITLFPCAENGGFYSEKPFLPRLAGDLHTSYKTDSHRPSALFLCIRGITPPVQRHVDISLCYYYKRIIEECQDVFWDGIKFAQFPSRSPLSYKGDLRRQGVRLRTYRAEDRNALQAFRGVLCCFLRPKVRERKGLPF